MPDSKSVYSIDMRVHDMRVNAKSSTGSVAGWSVEFDGPVHIRKEGVSKGQTAHVTIINDSSKECDN